MSVIVVTKISTTPGDRGEHIDGPHRSQLLFLREILLCGQTELRLNADTDETLTCTEIVLGDSDGRRRRILVAESVDKIAAMIKGCSQG